MLRSPYGKRPEKSTVLRVLFWNPSFQKNGACSFFSPIQLDFCLKDLLFTMLDLPFFLGSPKSTAGSLGSAGDFGG